MQKVDVLAVVGSCAPERRRYAKGLATATHRMFVPSDRLAASGDPVEEAAASARYSGGPAGVVIDLPAEVDMTELIGTLADPEAPTRLNGVICIADASHLLDDLRRDSYASRRPLPEQHPDLVQYTAHAMFTVTQMEFASTIVLVNWEPLPTHDLSMIMALVSHLSPHARLRLDRGRIETFHPRIPYTTAEERPGWVGMLNQEYAPYMTDRRVSAFRWENIRPLHPQRLLRLLDRRIDRGEFGTVIRSAGFCRLATRSRIATRWDHVGRTISFDPLGSDDGLAEGEEMLALGEDIAFIGLDLDHSALIAALDHATLSDDEMDAGPQAWARYVDPFPIWSAAPDLSE